MRPKVRMLRLRALGVAVAVAIMAGGIVGCDDDNDGAAREAPLIGYALLSAENPWLNSVFRGAEAQIEAMGGTVEVRDSQLDPDLQVSILEEFITLDVDAIIIGQAQIPDALIGVLERASDAGIKIFAHEWDYSDLEEPPAPPIDGQVLADRGLSGREVVEVIEQVTGPDSRLFQIGFPFPIPSLDFVDSNMAEALEDQPGMTLLERVDNPDDTAEGARPLMEAALAQHDQIDAVVSYNGPTALGVLRALRADGSEDDVIILNTQMDETSAEEPGIDVQWELLPVTMGQELARLAMSAATGEPEREWRRTILVEAIRYDESNIDDWVPWSEQLDEIG